MNYLYLNSTNDAVIRRSIRNTALAICGAMVLLGPQTDARAQSANMPTTYEEPGGGASRAGDSGLGVETIDPFTGALRIVVTDLSIPMNGGLDLSVTRNYQSFIPDQDVTPRRTYQAGRTVTGVGWDLHYGRLWKAGAGTGGVTVLGAFPSSNPHGCKVDNVSSRNNPVLELPDGSRKLFAIKNTSGGNFDYITTDRWILRCLPTSSDDFGHGGAIVISPDGIKYTFNFFHRVSSQAVSNNIRDGFSDIAYHVTKIEHPNGTYIDIDYKSKASTYFAELVRAQHSESTDARIEFVYTRDGSDATSPTAAHRLRSFKQYQTDREWVFIYDDVDYGSGVSNGAFGPYEYLKSVVRPDGRSTDYSYIGDIEVGQIDGKFSLRKIILPLEGEIEYFYDQENFPERDATNNNNVNVVDRKELKRGVSSSAKDVWTYNYRPASLGSTASDYTDVSGPNDCVTYQHYVRRVVGTGWKVGSLSSRTVKEPNSSSSTLHCNNGSAVLTETYDWEADWVSAQGNYRYPLLTDGSTNGARPRRKTVEVDGSTYVTDYLSYDAYGNPRVIEEDGHGVTSGGSNQNVSRTTDLTYYTNESAWIINRTEDEDVEVNNETYSIDRRYHTSSNYLGLLEIECKNGNISGSSCSGGVGTKFQYYPASNDSVGGALWKVTDANNNVTTFSNYKRGQARLTTRLINSGSSALQSTTQVINDEGTVQSVTDSTGRKTSFTYDDMNRVQTVSTARTDDHDIVISRTSSGKMKETITRGPLKEIREHDGFGQVIRRDWSDTSTSNAAAPIFQKYEFDAEGRVIKRFQTNSNVSFTRTDYDALGRQDRVILPGGVDDVNYNYLSNNRVQMVDENSFATIYGYRSFGDPFSRNIVYIRAPTNLSSESAAYQTTHITRNVIGQVKTVAQGGLSRAYDYNGNFFLDEEIHPEVGTVVYTHDSIGNVKTRKVGSSPTTSFDYDLLHRIRKITYPDGRNIDYDYYDNDQLKQVARGSTTWDYLYDNNNNLKSETLAITANSQYPVARTFAFSHTYDMNDSLDTISYPSGLKIEYDPNPYGRATNVSAKIGSAVTTGFASLIDYHPNGQLKTLTTSNGVSTNYGQDDRDRTTTFVTSNGSGVILNRLHTYDPADNLKSIVDNLNSANTRTMTYDGLNRLRTASGAWGAGTMTYDAVNNIKTKVFGSDSLTYAYNSTSNKLTSTSGSSALAFGYDVYGNTTSTGRTTYGNFTFDDASLLTFVEDSDGTDRIQYDHDGNRRTVLDRSLDGTSTKYKAYSVSGDLMYEEDVVSNIAKDYIYVGSSLISTRARCTSSVDTDSDGISNCIEAQNGLDPTFSGDALEDWDGDGLTNLGEIQLGTNLYNSDTDGDGLTDGYESQYGLNALVSDSGLDGDNDGLTNLEEFQLGTDPSNADTDGDGLDDGVDSNPLFNSAVLIPIISLILN